MLEKLKRLWARTGEPVGDPHAPDAGPPPPEEPEEPELEVLSYREVLLFRSSRELPVGEEFPAPALLPEGESGPVRLRTRTRKALEPGRWEYTADAAGPDEALALLRERYGPEARARAGQPERRAARRVRHRIRVRSHHLPHFQGLTHDLSSLGVRLIVEGEVAPGTDLDLDVQLDHDRLPNVKARGVAVWTAPLEGRGWWLGVRLAEVGDPASLGEYLEGLGTADEDGLTRKNFLD